MSNRLPRVCFVAPYAFPLLSGDEQTPRIGGAELQQVIVARGLAERGYPVSMICLDFGQEDDVEINGIRVIRAFRPAAGIPVIRFVWPRLTSIWKCLARADADIYYQRAASILTGIIAAFSRRNGRKSVFAAAGNPDLEANTSRIRLARDRWIYEYGLSHVDRIVVQNEEQERLCRQNFGRDATPLPNCYPLVDVPPNPAAHKVLWVSTIRRLKRPERFLDLAEALPNYQFCMVGGPGDGEAALFDSIKRRAATLANVEFQGFIPYAKIDTFFNDASVFVNTSETEGFPNTFLQAWARGVPVISFVDCGARVDGLPVCSRVGSIEEMADRLVIWLENDTARLQAGEKSREYLENNHSLEPVLDLYEQLFRQLLAETA